MLLCPRDYLSSFMKIGTIAFLIFGVMIVNPELHMPAVSQFAAGGGPIIPGQAFPLLVHHHRLRRDLRLSRAIGSGTTPKMIDKESHIRTIGYGTMLLEGLIGIIT